MQQDSTYILYSWIFLCFSVQELSQLQDKHATRPDVFDDVEEEQEIEILTQEITQVQTLTRVKCRDSVLP